MKISLLLAVVIFLTSYALFVICFMYEFMKTKHKYLNKINFLHTLLRLSNNKIKNLRNELKELKNAEKETTES